jgi:hypothetical protein
MTHWTPHPNNKRSNNVGYVQINKTKHSNNKNLIKLYTRVLYRNGKWAPDPASKHGNYYKTQNGKNFQKVTNLYGYYPVQAELRWSAVPKRAPNKKPNNSVPSNFVMPAFPGL